MAKPPKLGKTNLPENELKHKGIKAHKKPQKIRKKKSHKIEEIEQEHIRVRPRYKDYTKKEKEKRERTPEEIAEAKRKRSEAQKEYWRKLKETDPEKYQERINKLHRKTPEVSKVDENVSDIETPQVKDTSDIIETPNLEDDDKIGKIIVDLEEDFEQETSEYRDFKKLSENLNDIEKEYYKDTDYKTYEDIVIANFSINAIMHPDLRGSPLFLEWIDNIKNIFQDKASEIIVEASKNFDKISVYELYEIETTVDYITKVMNWWYNEGYMEDFGSEEDYYNFQSALFKSIDKAVNDDEVFRYYE